VAESVNFGSGTLGVRIPKHWFSDIVSKIDTPVITTSANISGQNFVTCAEDLDPMIVMRCSFMIDEGPIRGKPSTIINLASDVISIRER
ncbi:Sua5/YciO/YrdC/YwlC family protein, partial [bacterium]|nr:Sua5/YciO/YrdC/YwlC family protein [bacterium]